MNFIIIDGGTTNTRVSLVCCGNLVQRIKISIGADGRTFLKEKIKESIFIILDKHNLSQDQIEAIIASGMITSEFGLCEVPHVLAPTDKHEIAINCSTLTFKDICNIPFFFIPGIKNEDESDFMRGEETEFFGLPEQYIKEKNVLAVLPGSHTKLINYSNGKIFDCITTMCGEMFSALSSDTVLKNSIHDLFKNYDREAMLDGYKFSQNHGLNQALFRVRINDRSYKHPVEKLNGFFIGAVIFSDIQLILNLNSERIIVGGSNPLRGIFCYMLQALSKKEIINLGGAAETLQISGALAIWNENQRAATDFCKIK